jgi:murein L,D-transpeptidase YcbB/YkuD
MYSILTAGPEDGRTHFREDIYARERVLAQYFPVPAE